MNPLLAFALGGSGFVAKALFDRLRDYHPDRRGLSDLLPAFAFVHSGPPAVVLNKEGSFTASLRLQGPDRASSTDEELNALIAHVSRSLSPFTNRWTFHVDLQRKPAPAYPQEGSFPDPLTAFLDDRRRIAYLSHGALFDSQTLLSITYRPPREVYQHVLVRLQQGVAEERRTWVDNLTSFREQVDILSSRLTGQLRVTPLNRDELLQHLYSCLTGLHQRVIDPGPGIYLDQVLATQHLTAGWEPRVGPLHVSPVAFFHLPGRLQPAHLDALTDLPFPFRLSCRFVPLDSRSAQAIIDRYTLGWFWSQKSLRDLLTTSSRTDDPFVNGHATAMLADAADATKINQEAQHRFAYLTALILVYAPTRQEANDRAQHVAKLLEDLGLTTRRETYNATAAFHGSIPGESAANLRSPLVNLLPISAALPLTSLWSGLERHPCSFYPPDSPPILIGRTEGSTPFRLYLHSGDLGHTVVVGPPGTGKSTLLQAIAAGHLRYPGAKVYFFDRDHSSLLYANAASAKHYDIGKDDALSFQPLARIDNPEQRAATLTWLEALVSLQLPLSVDHSRALSKALDNVAALSEASLRTLEVLANSLADRELRTAIELFTKGPYQALLGGHVDSLQTGRFQVFEMRTLLDLEPKVSLPVLLYMLDRIERDLDGSPTLIILDEAGLALLHKVFAHRIKAWALTLRKKNAAIILALQALSQLEGNNSFSTLLQSCPTRIFLPNENATSPTVRPVYEACGLNPRQIELISLARRKRDYYFANPEGARLFGLALTPAELAFFGTLPGRSLQETHLVMERLITTYGDTWRQEWLRLWDLNADAAAFATFAKEFTS